MRMSDRKNDRKNDQKIENLLNLALDTPQKEREKSELLESGYQPIYTHLAGHCALQQ